MSDLNGYCGRIVNNRAAYTQSADQQLPNISYLGYMWSIAT